VSTVDPSSFSAGAFVGERLAPTVLVDELDACGFEHPAHCQIICRGQPLPHERYG
jgi:hypothetical protein